jgi:hypothetical protein
VDVSCRAAGEQLGGPLLAIAHCDTHVLSDGVHAKAEASRRAAFPADRRRLTRTRPVVVRAVVQPGGSAGAKLVVEHDYAAGGVVRDVRAHRLALGGSARCTQRGRIVEVGLEHAEIR